MRMLLPLAAVALLLSGAAGHAFTSQPLDGSTALGRAALNGDPDDRLTTRDDGHGTTTTKLGNGSFSYGVTREQGWSMGPPGSQPFAPSPFMQPYSGNRMGPR
jgi:hypothetical protein